MTTYNITKIKPTTLANNFALLYGSFGTIVASIRFVSTQGIAYALGYVFGALLVGYITGIILAYLYNFFVKYTGGLQVEVSEKTNS